LPSIFAWGATVFVCVRELQGGPCWRSATLAVLAWLVLDRIQLFYATEARVYAAVQLVSLLAWMAVARIGEARERRGNPRLAALVPIASTSPTAMSCRQAGISEAQEINEARGNEARGNEAQVNEAQVNEAQARTNQALGASPAPIWLWCGLSILLVFLHVTAVLAVAWQIVCGTWLVAKRAPHLRLTWAVAVAVVIVAVGVALLLSAQVWEHRQRWASFAGEASLASLVGLFPLAAYVVPVMLARGLDWVWGSGKVVTGDQAGAAKDKSRSPTWLWWVAVAGPWLSAWCITVLQIAPVFHRRFVIVAAVPLVMLAASQLGRVRHASLRWGAMVAVAAWLIVSQGTLLNWRAGQLFGWQRTEGWRQAGQFLSEHLQSGDQLWCASGLIEGQGAELPLSEPLDRYLSFPLRGMYGVVDNKGELIEPHALVGDGASWARQMLSEDHVGRIASSGSAVWLVYRGSPAAFEMHCRKWASGLEAGSQEHWRLDAPQAFGLVSVVRASRD
jgi:hypothetical protein